MAALPAGILASGLNEQIHRRHTSLQREFRKALEDSVICEQEEHDIEALRKSLGLSPSAAEHIRAQVQSEAQNRLTICPHCGHKNP